MELETFQDVLASIKKNKGRPFHLLVGNGFSIAYDPKIFSYNALYNFIEDLDDADLAAVLPRLDRVAGCAVPLVDRGTVGRAGEKKEGERRAAHFAFFSTIMIRSSPDSGR